MRELTRKELLKRLKFVLKRYKPEDRGIDLKLLFDEDVWAVWDNGHFYSERVKNLEIAPREIFVVRKSILGKFSKDKYSYDEVKAVFEEGDEYVLDSFTRSGTPEDIVSKCNNWYFQSYGDEVFHTKSGRIVPNKISNDEIFEKANAHYLHQKLRNKQIESGSINILKLANGKKAIPHISFMDEFLKLDQQHATNFYSKLNYIITDFCSPMVNKVREEIIKNGRHLDRFQFRTLDILKDKIDEGLAVIDSSYLFDSISQPLIAKIADNLFEVHIRGVINDCLPIIGKNHKKITAQKFKAMLAGNNYTEINKIAPLSFNAIQIERKFVQTEKVSNEIKELYKDIPLAVIPTNSFLIEFISKLKLAKGGYFQAFEFGVENLNEAAMIRKGFTRYNGNITSPINFVLIKRFYKNAEIIKSTNYLEESFGRKVIRVDNICKSMQTHNEFNTIFPYSFNKNYEKLKKLETKILAKSDYSEESLNKFTAKIQELLAWKKHKWLETHFYKKSFVFDFFESLCLYYKNAFSGRIEKKSLWLIDGDKNLHFMKMVKQLGYDEKLVSHLFTMAEKLNEKDNFILLRVSSTAQN